MKRRLPELAILLGAASILLSAVLFYVIQSEARGRRDQSCTQSEREHKVLVDQLRERYRLLASPEARRQLGPGLVQIVVQQLPETERQARVDVAPEFCDEEDIGLAEPDPKLPKPRDFSHLLEGTRREREQLRRRAREAQRANGHGDRGGGGRSPGSDPRSQHPPSRQPRRDGGGNQGQPSPTPQTPSEQPQPGPPGQQGPPGPSGPAVPSTPPPAPPPEPAPEPPRGPVQGLLEEVGGLVDELLPLRP